MKVTWNANGKAMSHNVSGSCWLDDLVPHLAVLSGDHNAKITDISILPEESNHETEKEDAERWDGLS